MDINTAIALIREKDERGLAFLHDNYSNALLGIIVRIVKSKELGEDILQTTFMKIWSKIDTYDAEQATIFTWMARIARNAAIDQRRLKKFEYRQMTDQIDDRIHGGAVQSDHSGMDVQVLTRNMDEKYKVVLDCIYLQGYSHSEAAELLDLPIGTVKTRLRKSIEILKDTLKDEKVLFTGGLLALFYIVQWLWI